MQSGSILFEQPANKNIDFIIFGETFYLQLFLNFNIFKLKRISVLDIGNDLTSLWTDNIELNIIKDFPKESNGYVVLCGMDKDLKTKYADKCDYDFFDIDSIKENGTFVFNGECYIVDDVKYVASAPEYMKRAYKNVPQEQLYDYLQELVKEPAGRCFSNTNICLYEYNGKYIHHLNGRRKNIYLPDSFTKTIHVFGDSRVSGYMLEDKDLFTNMLQATLNSTGKKYRILNYGIPGREIDRMEYQVKKADIKNNDIVFIATGCYEYRSDAHEKQMEFALYLKKIQKYLDDKSVKLCYINLPTTVEIMNPSSDEELINKLYRNYKFNEYTLETVSHYKSYLFSLLSKYSIWFYDISVDFNMPHNDLLFINMHHYSPAGNKILADALFELVSMSDLSVDKNKASFFLAQSTKNIRKYVGNEKKRQSVLRRTHVQIRGGGVFSFNVKLWIVSFLKELFFVRRNYLKGAIVMNANPFTLGHRYLVEFASQNCDHLYIFVLQEDKSDFSYYDRIEMVYNGVKDIKNVTVRPSGKEIISDETFPEYFMKKELQDEKINAYRDIESFARNVAPLWGIKVRFFGEEPFDKVTAQYNEQMKLYFPEFYIDTVEIPRKVINNEVISATKVRELLKHDDWIGVQRLVPKSTLKYLKKMKSRK